MPGPDPKDAVVIVGAGGHAKVVIDLLNSSGVPIFGLTDVDGSPTSGLRCAGSRQ